MTANVKTANVITLPNGTTFDLSNCESFQISFDATSKQLNVSYYKLIKEVISVQPIKIETPVNNEKATESPRKRGTIILDAKKQVGIKRKFANRTPQKVIAKIPVAIVAELCVLYMQGNNADKLAKPYGIKGTTITGWANAINRILAGVPVKCVAKKAKEAALYIKSNPKMLTDFSK